MTYDWQTAVKREYSYDPNPGTFSPLSPNEIERLRKLSKNFQGVDPSIRNLIIRLNDAGYYTTGSCSGLTADHRIAPQHSYIWFAKTDRMRLDNIVRAADVADLLVIYHGTMSQFGPEQGTIQYEMVEVRSPRRPKSDEEIRKAWRLFSRSIFGER